MRILSLHYPLPNAEIDNKDIFNAPSLFEYDVIIFHPLGFEQSIFNWLNEEEEFYTASGEKVIQEPTGNNERNIHEILEQRRNEINTFLKRDGILIMYTVPEMAITSEPGEHTVVQKNIFSRLFSIIFPQSSKQEAEEPLNEQFSTSRYSLINFDDAIGGVVAKRDRPEKNIFELIIPGSGFPNMTENDFNYLNNNIFQNLLRNHAKNIAHQAYFDSSLQAFSSFPAILTTVKSETIIALTVNGAYGQIFFLPCFTQASTDDAMTEARLLVNDINLIMNK